MPEGACCEIRLSDGNDLIIGDPEDWDWSRGGDQWVVAYRPVLDADSKPEPEWDGEGLPPVGCRIKVHHEGRGKWVDAEVVGKHKQCAVVYVECLHTYLSYGCENITPIRTAAQRAEDEEIKRMAKIMYDCDAAGNISAEAAAEALYRAGYRKHT